MARNKIPRPQERPEFLTLTRNTKMARSAHAYVRGSTVKFYEWLETADASLPKGPPIWICGDCHIGNLGPLASEDGRVAVQIRDLDQTVIGNPAHDLVRLALSLASAARGSDLPGVTTAHMLEEVMVGYHQGLVADSGGAADEQPKIIRSLLKKASGRRWYYLAEERLEDVTPSIPRGRRFWEPTKQERRELKQLFETEELRDLVTSLRGRRPKDVIEVLDAAYWMKGCSSLGRLRYAVLLRVGRSKRWKHCLVDLKEGVTAAAPRAPKSTMPKENAERVVAGARALSPYLGNRMLAARLLGKSMVVRELMPQDLKLEIDQFTREQAVTVARYLARVVGRAHARQMDDVTRKSWAAELSRNRSKTLDAPGWLWSSVVDLLALHEVAYLDHCRRHAALDKAAA